MVGHWNALGPVTWLFLNFPPLFFELRGNTTWNDRYVNLVTHTHNPLQRIPKESIRLVHNGVRIDATTKLSDVSQCMHHKSTGDFCPSGFPLLGKTSVRKIGAWWI